MAQTITGSIQVAAVAPSGTPNFQFVLTEFGVNAQAGTYLSFALQVRNIGTAAGAPTLASSVLTGPLAYPGAMQVVSPPTIAPNGGVAYVQFRATAPFASGRTGSFYTKLVLHSGSTSIGTGPVATPVTTTSSSGSTSASSSSSSTSSSSGSDVAAGTGSTVCAQAQSYLQHLEASASAIIASYIAAGMSSATANALYQNTLQNQRNYVSQVCG